MTTFLAWLLDNEVNKVIFLLGGLLQFILWAYLIRAHYVLRKRLFSIELRHKNLIKKVTRVPRDIDTRVSKEVRRMTGEIAVMNPSLVVDPSEFDDSDMDDTRERSR